MRVCILKQPNAVEFIWSTHRWSNAQELLDNYVMRSTNFGLVCETQADIWVVEDGEYVSDTYVSLLTRAPEGVNALYRSHSAAKWADIPWEEYDVIISLDPIVSDSIIIRYPEILWCYYEQEHAMESFRASAKSPFGKYDLFLNHALSSSNDPIIGLPRSINLPYVYSRDAFNRVVTAEKHERVYLDSRCIRDIPHLEFFRMQLARKLGIEIDHCKPWDFKNSHLCVANKVPSSTREYLNQLASCKYFLLNRGGSNNIGQSAPEAAALGVIVLSDKYQIYSHYVCHPKTWVRPRDYDSTAGVIKEIQKDPNLQRKIIEYQFERTQNLFLNQPLRVLRSCLKMKRGVKPGNIYTVYSEHGTDSLPQMAKKSVKYIRRLLGGVKRRLCREGVEEVAEMRRHLFFHLKTFRSEKVQCRKLSIIFAGQRNASYATDFKERMMAAIERNQQEVAKISLEVEWIFVEWNPLSEDYLSYELAKKGFRCYVVSPDIHKRVISPQVSDRMVFMQFFAKNVGIRRATGDWFLVTNADCVFDEEIWKVVSNECLCPEILYRAERCDIPASRFDKPFKVMRENLIRRHSIGGGSDFAQAAGDFLLFSSQNLLGFDETVNFSDVHVDGRFCYNWSALRSRGDLGNWHFFRFIGQVFKADHELTFVKTQHLENLPRGFKNWNSRFKTCKGMALYRNSQKWGMIEEPETEIREGVWYIG